MSIYHTANRFVLFVVWTLVMLTNAVNAQTLLESSAEARYQLDLQVSQSALQKFIPEGWSTNVSTEGASKDANLRVIFIERLTINGPDGKPVGDGSNLLVYLTVPVRNPAGEEAQLVIGGITEDPADAPGPFDVYLPATTHTFKRTTSSGSGPIIETQDWKFATATGEHAEMSITFERAVATRRPARDTLFYSAMNPEIYQISSQQQVLDIMRNVTTEPVDRVHEFSFKAGGGSFADLFDGAEKILSWDNIIWVNREVYLP